MASQRQHQRARLASELLGKRAPASESVSPKPGTERLFYKKGAASTAPFRPLSWTYGREVPDEAAQRERRRRPKARPPSRKA